MRDAVVTPKASAYSRSSARPRAARARSPRRSPADPGRAGLRRLGAALPRPADPDEPVARRASSGSGRSTTRRRSPSTRRSRTRRSTRRSRRPDAGRRRRHRPVLPRRAGRARAFRRRPSPARASAGSALYDERRRGTRTRSSPSAIPPRPRPSTRTTAGASSARSSSPRRAHSLARRPALGRRHAPADDWSSGSTSRRRSSSAGSRRGRGRCSRRASRRRCGARSRGRSRRPPARSWACEEVAELPRGEAEAALVAAHAAARRLPAEVDAPDPRPR